MSEEAVEDRRIRKTRDSVTQALMDLLAEQTYDQISVVDLIEKADVGRSTFYQHFTGKEEVLRAVVDGGFEALADLTVDGPQTQYLVDWLEIFWNHKIAARQLLADTSRVIAVRALVDQVHERLERLAGKSERRPEAGLKVAAHFIAEGQIGAIHAWLAGQASASPQTMAASLKQATAALTAGFFGR